MAENNKSTVLEVLESSKRNTNWTSANYFKGVAKFKWWVIGSTVVATVGGYLGFRFLINKATENITASYVYNLAADVDENGTFRFIDGTLFDYYDIVARENLEAIKASKDEYKSIDVDKIVEGGKLSVTKKVTTYDDNSTQIDTAYVITAKASVFPNNKLGQAFIYDLLMSPKSISSKAIENYSVQSVLTDSFDDLALPKQAELLKQQYSIISESLEDLTKDFSDTIYVSSSGQKLYDFANSIKNKYSNGAVSALDYLYGSLYANHYWNYVEGEEDEAIEEIKELARSYINTLYEYRDQQAALKDSLASLLGPNIHIDFNEVVTDSKKQENDYLKNAVEIDKKIRDLQTKMDNLEKELTLHGYVPDSEGKYGPEPTAAESTVKALTDKKPAWVQGCKDFKEKIAIAKESLVADVSATSNAVRYAYATYQNKVTVLGNGYTVLNGHVSSVIGAAAGLVIGYVASSFICAAIYINKNLGKDKPAKKEDKE